jgi:hypothetical protein
MGYAFHGAGADIGRKDSFLSRTKYVKQKKGGIQ